jgi:HEAT repeat protein/MFS family permease
MSKPAIHSLEIVRGMRLCIIATAFCSCYCICIAPQFLNGFALLLGAGPVQIALLTSLPMAGLTVQLLSTLFFQQAPKRKPIWFWLASVHRLLWVPITLIPILAGWIGRGYASFLTLFFILFSVSSVLGSMATPPWFSWMADLIPKEQAGRFWGRRVAVFSLVCVIGIPMGWLTDSFPKDSFWPYALLFGMAALMGEAEILINNRVIEPPATPPVTGVPYWQLLLEPFQHPDFRRLLLFTCFHYMAVFFADGFVMAFLLEKLQLTQSFIALAVSLMWLTRWGIARYWGFLGDRFGHASVLKICAAALIIWPVPLIFWGHTYPHVTVLVAYLFAGLFNVGFETSFTSMMLGLAPAAKKSTFVSVLQACAGVTGAVAPLIGGAYLTSLQGFDFRFQELTLDNYQILLLTGAVLRIIPVFLIKLRSQEVKAPASPVMIVRRLMDANPFKVIHHSYVLDEGSVEADRVDAVHELADAASDLASEQLVRALQDPSLEVRRGAVLALAEIREKSTLLPLVELARSPESQIQPEAIEAIGRFQDWSQSRFLLGFLDDPVLRLAALRGLLHQKDPSTRDPLRHWAFLESASWEVRATAFEAWCGLMDPECIEPSLRFVLTTPSDFLRWQVVIALARITVVPVDFYAVLQRELRVPGEVITAESDMVHDAPLANARPRHVRRIANSLVHHAQSCYMQYQWKESTRALTLAILCFQEILSDLATLKNLHTVLSTKDRTEAKVSDEVTSILRNHESFLTRLIQEDSTTHPDLTLSLRLLDELRKSAMQAGQKTPLSEEPLLAFCLLRKFLGYETAT